MPFIEIDEHDLVLVLSPGTSIVGGIALSPYAKVKVLVGDRHIGMLSRFEVSVDASQPTPSVAATFLEGFDPAAPADTIRPDLDTYVERLASVGFVSVSSPWHQVARGRVETTVVGVPRYERTVFEE